jgi:hypothetical protein
MHIHEQRHHHNVPPDLFEEIPADAYQLPTCLAKKIRVWSVACDELELLFYRAENRGTE